MANYDLKTLLATPCARFDGSAASFALVQAICPDARMDPTHQRQVRVPAGGSHGLVRTMHTNDWITSVSTGIFLVFDDASFSAMFQASA